MSSRGQTASGLERKAVPRTEARENPSLPTAPRLPAVPPWGCELREHLSPNGKTADIQETTRTDDEVLSRTAVNSKRAR